MFYLGIDVAKAKLDCCLLVEPLLDKRKTKVVANSETGVADLLRWLARQGADLPSTHALLEGTGVYHETAAAALHEAGMQVSVLNPAQVRDFAKGVAVHTKNDAMDSAVLARYGALVKPARWQPPPVHVRELKALLARRQAVAQDLQRERNRMEKAQVSRAPERIHQSLGNTIAFLERELAALQQDIDNHIDRHHDLKDDSRLLQSIPAVGPQVGNHLLCVLRSSTFYSAEQLAAYLGITPVERQSGSSVRGRSRLSKTGPGHIRAMLYMAAIVGIRHNPQVKAVYERLLAKGKCKMAALGAAMRKIVHLCFGVWKNRTPYQKNFVTGG
jgi:transposase